MIMTRADDPSRDYVKAKIAAEIRRLRRRMGKTQVEACIEVFGTPDTQPYWSRWERALYIPQVASLEKIARWGGVSLDVFGVLPEEGPISASDLEEARELLRRAQAPGIDAEGVRELVRLAYEVLGGSEEE